MRMFRPRRGDGRLSSQPLTPPGQIVRARTFLLLGAFACAAAAMIFTGSPVHQTSAASAATAPVGAGFTVTAGDLAFILKQIKIAERHAATLTPANPCGTLVGPGADQIPDRLTSYGLRTVDGSCNNLFPGRETFAAADQPFPRLTTPDFRDAGGRSRRASRSALRRRRRTRRRRATSFDSQPRMSAT